MEDIVFRSVKPEQIQLAIAAQGGTVDDQKIYEIQWKSANEQPLDPMGASNESDKWLFLIDNNTLIQDMTSKLGGTNHVCSMFTDPNDDIASFTKVVSIITAANKESVLEMMLKTL